MKFKKFDKTNLFVIFMITLCLIILISPLIQSKLIDGDDYIFHITRINSLIDTLRNGIFPIKIHTSIFNTYGYGYSFFYSNFFLYIPAILTLMGFKLINAYKLFLVFIFIMQAIISYYSSYTIIKNKVIAIIPTILILLSHNYILNTYYRFALGEMLAFAFLPLVIAGAYNLVYERFNKPSLLIIGFVGIVLTHVITTVIAVCFCVCFVLIHIKRIFHEKNFSKLILAALVVCALTAYYWIPLIEQITYQTLWLAFPMVYSSNKCIILFNLFDNSTFTLGSGIVFPIIIMSGLSIMGKHQSRSTEFLIFGMITALLSTNLFESFWRFSEKIFNIQFPWRVLGLATILLSFAIGIWVNDELESHHIKFSDSKVIMGVLLLFITNYYFALNQISYVLDMTTEIQEATYYNDPIALGYTQEYLPKNITDMDSDTNVFTTPNCAISSNGNLIFGLKQGLSFTFKTNGSAYYDIPFINYKGYQVTSTNDHNATSISASDNGLVRVYVNDQTLTSITVKYVGTSAQTIAYLISGTTLITVIGFVILRKRKRK